MIVFPYYGGKHWILPYLRFPDHNIYCEPFVGGGSVFLNKPSVSFSVINDLDIFVYNAWKILQCWGVVKDEIRKQPWDLLFGDGRQKRIGFQCIRNEAKNYRIKQIPDARGFFLFIVRQKFGFDGVSWAPSSKLLSMSGAVTPDDMFKEYDDVFKKLNDNNYRVEIRNEDYKNIINDYKDRDDVFWYIDPPYIQALQRKYYGFRDNLNDVTPEDVAQALIDVKGKWCVSYNSSPRILRAFEKLNNVKFENVKVDYSKKQYCELVIYNF